MKKLLLITLYCLFIQSIAAQKLSRNVAEFDAIFYSKSGQLLNTGTLTLRYNEGIGCGSWLVKIKAEKHGNRFQGFEKEAVTLETKVTSDKVSKEDMIKYSIILRSDPLCFLIANVPNKGEDVRFGVSIGDFLVYMEVARCRFYKQHNHEQISNLLEVHNDRNTEVLFIKELKSFFEQTNSFIMRYYQ